MAQYIKVKQLLELLKGLDPNTPVVTTSSDHSYREVSVEIGTIISHPASNNLYEDHGYELDDGERRINSVIVY